MYDICGFCDNLAPACETTLRIKARKILYLWISLGQYNQ